LARDRATGKPSPIKSELFASVDDRLVCLTRLILACSALVITFIDPSEPDRLVYITYGALCLYVAYSATVYLLALRAALPARSRIIHWVDVGWYLLLVSLSSGTSSIFFFFFFYAILVASFRWGFREGLTVTIVSAILFTIIGYATAPAGHEFELNRLLLRPIYLLALGYLMAYWGGAEIDLKRRLALLREVNTLSNPRFGIAQTILTMMKSVRAFYEADTALLILGNSMEASEFQLTRVSLVNTTAAQDAEVESEALPRELARQFFALPETVAAVYTARRRLRQSPKAFCHALDTTTGLRTINAGEACASLAVMLDADSFITVPLIYRSRSVGRVFLSANHRRFDYADVEFLQQVVEHVIPSLSNVRLLDQLASKAAEHERQKIARDLHDSVIQPYIGLQYKLAAIRNKLRSGALIDVTYDLDHLFDMTVDEITGLRHYVRGLKDTETGRDHLLSAVRRYTEQFQENYGIDVEVVFQTDLMITDRLAAELIQMVHEGLRNAWKHTEATHCTVKLESKDNYLLLSIENNNAPPEELAHFSPRSLSERAESLGGHLRVERNGQDHTIICVRIPL
jgi:signal transduction histidine kinase